MTWAVERHHESPAAFHAREPAPGGRAVWVCEPSGPALVLGSTQRTSVVDADACERAGMPVVRRRSGGGAVLVEPGALLWVDVVVPAGDPLWERDVGRAFLWLGDAWRRSLADVGVAASVHRGALRRTRWSDLVCFAGLGPGELTTSRGAKVVGLSQRRTRDVARFQCAVLLRWQPAALVALLALAEATRDDVADELASAATGVAAEAGSLLDAFLRHLPA